MIEEIILDENNVKAKRDSYERCKYKRKLKDLKKEAEVGVEYQLDDEIVVEFKSLKQGDGV